MEGRCRRCGPSAGVQTENRDNVTPLAAEASTWTPSAGQAAHTRAHTDAHWHSCCFDFPWLCGWNGCLIGCGRWEWREGGMCLCSGARGAGTCWCSPMCGYHTGMWRVGGRGSGGGGTRWRDGYELEAAKTEAGIMEGGVRCWNIDGPWVLITSSVNLYVVWYIPLEVPYWIHFQVERRRLA